MVYYASVLTSAVLTISPKRIFIYFHSSKLIPKSLSIYLKLGCTLRGLEVIQKFNNNDNNNEDQYKYQ